MPPKGRKKGYRKYPPRVQGPRRFSVWKSLQNPNHIFRHVLRGEPYYLTNNNQGAGLGSGYNILAALSYADQYTTYTALYDSYRIVQSIHKFYPLANSNDMSGLDSITNPANMQPIFSVIDYDDQGTPSLASLFEYASMKSHEYGKPFTISFEPHVNNVIDTGIAATSSLKSPWIDCANPSVVHFGIKLWQPDCGVGTNNLWVCISEYHVEFRGQR